MLSLIWCVWIVIYRMVGGGVKNMIPEEDTNSICTAHVFELERQLGETLLYLYRARWVSHTESKQHRAATGALIAVSSWDIPTAWTSFHRVPTAAVCLKGSCAPLIWIIKVDPPELLSALWNTITSIFRMYKIILLLFLDLLNVCSF